MISFKIAEHSLRPDTQMVEVFDDGRFLAAVYDDPDIPALKIVSKHLDPGSAIMDADPPEMPPAVLIAFKA